MDKAKLDELRNRAQDWCYDDNGYGKMGIALWPEEHAALFAYIDELLAQIESLENSMDELSRASERD